MSAHLGLGVDKKADATVVRLGGKQAAEILGEGCYLRHLRLRTDVAAGSMRPSSAAEMSPMPE